MSDYDKFISPNLNRVKQGNGAFTAARGEPSISTKDLNPPTIADREEMQAVKKVVTNGSSNPITLSAIGIGLLSLATMLGVRLHRGLQPATVLASSGGLGPLMPMNTASALDDKVMEMQSQDPNINGSAAVLETRPAHNVKSNRVGWGQLSSQNSRPLTLCYVAQVTVEALDDAVTAKVIGTELQEMLDREWLEQDCHAVIGKSAADAYLGARAKGLDDVGSILVHVGEVMSAEFPADAFVGPWDCANFVSDTLVALASGERSGCSSVPTVAELEARAAEFGSETS